MQTTANGEYIPSKELDMNFKIPKTNQQQQQQQQHEEQQQQQQQQMYYPVLDNSYYAYQQPEMAHYQYQYHYQYDPSQNVYMKLLEYKKGGEKPKNQSDQIMRDTIPDYFDETLPKELITLFQPLYCKLCAAQLSSNIVARLHYKSKNHEKKIRKFLIEYSERTGEPLHKRARLSIKQQNNNDNNNTDNNVNDNPLYYYCDVCDLSLTGKLHAESHYMGRNHKKALLGLKNPAGKGHYDSNGKWIRELQSRSSTTTVGDNFGEAFRIQQQQQQQQQPLIGPVLEKPSTSTQQQRHPTNTNFFCELCNITTTCQEQLECHYKGQKHLKKLKRLNPDATIVINPENNKICEIWDGDCTKYRTPSGSFYCPICNLSLNVEQQFKQHMISKSHMKKVAAQKN